MDETAVNFNVGDVVKTKTQNCRFIFPVGTIGIVIEKGGEHYLVENEEGTADWAYHDGDLESA